MCAAHTPRSSCGHQGGQVIIQYCVFGVLTQAGEWGGRTPWSLMLWFASNVLTSGCSSQSSLACLFYCSLCCYQTFIHGFRSSFGSDRRFGFVDVCLGWLSPFNVVALLVGVHSCFCYCCRTFCYVCWP